MAKIRNETEYYTAIATGDLTGKFGYGIALDTSNPGQVIIGNAQTTKNIGVLYAENQLGITAGSRVTVLLPQRGTAVVIYGGTVAIGDKLTLDSSGRFITTTTSGDQVLAIAKEAGAVGEYHEAILYQGFVH